MNEKIYISWLEERVVTLEVELAKAHQDHLDSLNRLIQSVQNPQVNA
jgi:hypothetical protein